MASTSSLVSASCAGSACGAVKGLPAANGLAKGNSRFSGATGPSFFVGTTCATERPPGPCTRRGADRSYRLRSFVSAGRKSSSTWLVGSRCARHRTSRRRASRSAASHDDASATLARFAVHRLRLAPHHLRSDGAVGRFCGSGRLCETCTFHPHYRTVTPRVSAGRRPRVHVASHASPTPGLPHECGDPRVRRTALFRRRTGR